MSTPAPIPRGRIHIYTSPISQRKYMAFDLTLRVSPSLPAAPPQIWRVYQRGLERWIIDLLQPLFDSLVKDGMVPRFVQVGCTGWLYR